MILVDGKYIKLKYIGVC